MCFNTNWNVEVYRTKFESDEHWALKRDFILMHKDKFPEGRLACLAQVFVNVEFMGCRYPIAVMKQVYELSEDIVSAYRESRKDSLKRTFIKASDAANAKVTGKKRSRNETNSTEKKGIFPIDDASKPSPKEAKSRKKADGTKKAVKYPIDVMKQVPELSEDNVSTYRENSKDSLKRTFVKASDTANAKVTGKKRSRNETNSTEKKGIFPIDDASKHSPKKADSTKKVVKNNGLPSLISDIILLLPKSRPANSTAGKPNLMHVLNLSLSKSERDLEVVNKKLKCGSKRCSIYVSGILIGKSKCNFEKKARYIAARRALQFLSKGCYSLKVVENQYSESGIIALDNIDDTKRLEEDKERKCEIVEKTHISLKEKNCDEIKISPKVNKLEKKKKTGKLQTKVKNLEMQYFAMQKNKEICNDEERGDMQNILSVGGPKKSLIPYDNEGIGAKLMELMGWSGGGLGKDEQGITDPIKASKARGRKGIGMNKRSKKKKKAENIDTGDEASPSFIGSMENKLTEFHDSNRCDDLIFSENFSYNQRKAIHSMVESKYSKALQSKSRGSGENRRIVVSHKVDDYSLVQNLLMKGGKTGKYEIILPGKLKVFRDCTR